jgi:endonuclease YncB( thermonuclease family)
MPAPPLGITARATIDRVVDGDTVDVNLMIPVRVRLRDCWAPETRGEEKEAGEAAKAQLERIIPRGVQVHVHVPTGEADAMTDVLTFGRALGDIYRLGDDESVAQLLVGLGFATDRKPE